MNLLEISDLHVEYTSRKGVSGTEQKIHALNGVSFDIQKGEILSIAGESGCGKSTLAKAVMKLIESSDGEIDFEGKNIAQIKKLDDIQKFYQKVQIIFQNPYSSLNPKMKIGQILREPLEINTRLKRAEINQIVAEKLSQVGLDTSVLDLYPHEFSGGQRQRIAIARALVMNPELIIADEPVSALDVSIQAQIINLLKTLKDNYNLTFLFISHDLSVIKYISDRIAVMYLGEIVEIGRTNEIFTAAKHPYTKALLSAVPQFTQQKEDNETITLSGELPSPDNLPNGCKFHTRCPYAMDKCKESEPYYSEFSPTHNCRCFLYEEK